MELTRFYLELRKDPHGPDVALFIGNLPANLSQKEYGGILLSYLDDGCRFSAIGPIYYEYGSMVITFDNSENAVQAYELLRNCKYEDKKLLGKDYLKIGAFIVTGCAFFSSHYAPNSQTVHGFAGGEPFACVRKC